MKNREPRNKRDVLFMIAITLAMAAWGGSWTSAKIIANMTAPEVLVFWRFVITFISFIPLIIIFKEKLLINLKSLLLTFCSALLMVVYNELFFAGLKTGLAGAGGVLVTCINPIFTFTITAFLFRLPIKLKEIVGSGLGFSGGLILLEIWHIAGQGLKLSGNLLFLIAAFVWAVLTIVSHKAQEQGTSTFVYSFYLYGISSLLDFLLALPHDVFNVFKLSGVFWINIIYLSFIATTFATTMYFWGSKKLGASQTSSFTFLVPVFAVLFSWLILGETPIVTTLLGGLMAMGAVYLINIKKNNALAPKGRRANGLLRQN